MTLFINYMAMLNILERTRRYTALCLYKYRNKGNVLASVGDLLSLYPGSPGNAATPQRVCAICVCVQARGVVVVESSSKTSTQVSVKSFKTRVGDLGVCRQICTQNDEEVV
jgi:hypothetical protein